MTKLILFSFLKSLNLTSALYSKFSSPLCSIFTFFLSLSRLFTKFFNSLSSSTSSNLCSMHELSKLGKKLLLEFSVPSSNP